MKTVAEIAKEYNVSVQTIYRKLNKVEPVKHNSLTQKNNGTAHFTDVGESYIRECLTPINAESQTVLNDVKQPESDEVIFLREQVKLLQTEITVEREHSRSQSYKLADLAE